MQLNLPVLLLVMSAALHGQAQSNLHFARYFQTDGLSQNSIHALITEPYCFCWAGTEDGLNRFDGYAFKIYRRRPGHSNSLSWNNISALAHDERTGLLWIGTIRKGINVYNRALDSFTHLPISISAKNSNEWVNHISFNGDNVWVATDSGAVIYSRTGFEVKNTYRTHSVVQRIVPVQKKVLIYFHNGNVWKVNENGQVELQLKASDVFGSDKIEIRNVTAADRHYISTNHGLYALDASAMHPKAILQRIKTATTDYTNAASTVYFKDSRGREWMGLTNTGMLIKLPKDSLFQLYAYNAAQPFSISDNNVNCIAEDAQQNIWIGTQKGLNRLLKYPQWLTSYINDGSEKSAMFNRVQTVFTADNQTIFFGSRSGLFVFNKAKNSVTKVAMDSAHKHERFYFIRPFSENIFMVSSYAGVQMLQNNGGKYFLHYSNKFPELDSLKRKRITTVAAINNDEYIFGGIQAGCWYWNKKLKQIVPISNSAEKRSYNYNVYHIMQVADSFFVATNKGLFSWRKNDVHLNAVPLKHFALADQPHINSLAASKGKLWMAFTSEGVGSLDLSHHQLQILNTDNSLRNNISYGIMADAAGRIWVSGVEGVAVITPGKNNVIYYSKHDGLQDNEFTNFSFWKSGDHLYFGGLNGLSVIDAGAYKPEEKIAPVILSRIEVLNGNKYEEWNRWSDLSFSHRQNSMNFFLALADAGMNHRVEYMYRLLPLEKEWINNGPLHNVSFTNLPPGAYTLEAKPRSAEVGDAAAVTTVNFSIIPAWYQTSVFKFLVIAAIAVFLFLLVRWYYLARLRKQRIEYEKLIAVQMERQRISSEIHDDIGAGLSGVRLLSEMTSNKMRDEEMKEEVSKIHSSIADLSGKMREVIWSLNTDNDTLENLVFYIRRQAEQLFENSPIHLSVALPENNIPEVELPGEKRRHIYLAVKEALHNCIKHSAAIMCHLKMEIQHTSLLITVQDNGKGFTTGNGFGNGLRNMQKRMDAVHGKVQMESKQGTSVQFLIPIT